MVGRRKSGHYIYIPGITCVSFRVHPASRTSLDVNMGQVVPGAILRWDPTFVNHRLYCRGGHQKRKGEQTTIALNCKIYD